MKKGKFLTKVISCLLVLCTALGATACAKGPNITGDSSKVNLLVWNYDGGVGHAWLDDAVSRFEAAKATTVYKGAGTDGQDLTGVDITVYNTKDDPLDSFSTKTHTVFFLQNVKYRNYVLDGNVQFMDITDIVTEDLESDGRSIEDKMSPELKSFLQKNDKYYVLPHYQTFDGIIYNKTLFEEKGFYFADDEADYKATETNDAAYGFIKSSTSKKTCGPDGVYNTYDDGLPSSVEEFKRLCNYITARGDNAFIWYKENGLQNYQNKLVNALWASLEGYEGAMANFTFNTGVVKTNIITDSTTMQTKSVAIDDSNAWEIYQQESRYHALDLANYIYVGDTGKSGKMRHSYTDITSVSNVQVQEAFLKGEAAMMVEGSYWENEASDSGVFTKTPSLKNVETAFMPLPIKATGTVEENQGRAPTMIDTLDSYALINKNVYDTNGTKASTVEQVAKEFLQFCYTDESLAKFTEKSSATKNLTYGVNATPNLTNATNFANSIWDVRSEGKCVTPVSGHAKYLNNQSVFDMTDSVIWTYKDAADAPKKYGDTVSPYLGFASKGMTVKEWFDGMKKDETWWNKLKG